MTDRPTITLSPSALLHAQVWAEEHVHIDRQLSPLGMAAMDALQPAAGETILDIGCGAGQTLLQLADGVGPEGRVIGVDIAAPLLAVARQRTSHLPQVQLVEADAQTWPAPDASADAVYSRFGVMGFTDLVAAFTNLRRILRPGGRLAFVSWRPLAENELDHLPLAAAGFAAPVDRSPFSLSDPDSIRPILQAAGFTGITITAHDSLVSSGDIDTMTDVLLKVGPLGRILRAAPDLHPGARQRLRHVLATRGNPASVALRAAVWIVTGKTTVPDIFPFYKYPLGVPGGEAPPATEPVGRRPEARQKARAKRSFHEPPSAGSAPIKSLPNP